MTSSPLLCTPSHFIAFWGVPGSVCWWWGAFFLTQRCAGFERFLAQTSTTWGQEAGRIVLCDSQNRVEPPVCEAPLSP